MEDNRCYWNKIVKTESREGKAFINRFEINIDRCRSCSGYERCGKYLTSKEALEEGSLIKFIKKL
jgi:hypothetical protein